MQRKLLITLLAVFFLATKACRTAHAQGPVLEHKPPVQVYQGIPFRLIARPLVPLKRVTLQIDLAGAELNMPMRLANKLFYLDIPGKSTTGRGPVTYRFVAVDAAGRSIEVNDPSGGRFRTRLLPPPLATLVYPLGNKATSDAFAVTIGLNEAFAVVPADSFRITFDNRGVPGLIVAPEQISFPVGPGLRNGPHTVKFETSALPGRKAYRRSWTFSLRKAPEEPVDKGGPLTVKIQTSSESANLGAPQMGQPTNLNLSWDGRFLGLDGGFITPALSPLTLADPTPLTFTDASLFGAQARLDLGPLGGRFILGQSVAGDASAYPQTTIAGGVVFGSYSLNVAAVFDDQSYLGTSLDAVARQSYVASLGYTAGSDEPGQRGGSVEIASALSFPDARRTADWTIVRTQAASPGADRSLKVLAMLQPLLQTFPIPDTTLSPPELGLGYRVTAWAPVGQAAGRLELSWLEGDFLSLGSAAYPGTTAVLMIAFDPERPATKPFTYDPGPVCESPENAADTYGLHLTGIGFDLFGDPARMGFDFFNSNWQGDAAAQTIRLLFGYYTYLDLDLVLESGDDSLEGHYYGIEGTGTRRIGLVTLAVSAGAHVLQEYRPDPAYGFGLKLKYDGNVGDLGLVVVLDLTYGDPFDFQPESPELAWSLGASVNF